MENKIPHIIHYFWFGGSKKSRIAQKCIQSWKQFLPDYEIVEWNESNFDVNIIPYTTQAYENKKYAFVSDYARLWVLYKYGGIYLDVDVEIIKNPTKIIEEGPFMGTERSVGANNDIYIAAGSMFGVSPTNQILKEIMCSYENDFFVQNGIVNQKTINQRFLEMFVSKGWNRQNCKQIISDIVLYPTCYFSPLDWKTKKIIKSDETYCIHWFSGSWTEQGMLTKIKLFAYRLVPDIILMKYFNYKRKRHGVN